MNVELSLFHQIIVALFLVIIGSFCAYTAQQKGRDYLTWFFIGIIFGLFGLIAILIMPPVHKEKGAEPADSGKPPPQFKDKLWFYLDIDRNQIGPISFGDLIAAWTGKSINRESYIWSEGMDNWMKVQDLKDLAVYLDGIRGE
jgi:glycerol uptake facilitator-like aquaporin